MISLREFLKEHCMDAEYPESLSGHLFFRFDGFETANYCFDDGSDGEVGINEAEILTLYIFGHDEIELPLDCTVRIESGEGMFIGARQFQVAKLTFIE